MNAKGQEEIQAAFKKVPTFTHTSIMNEKGCKFSESVMELYLTLFIMASLMIDMQFKISATNASEDVLQQQNTQLKKCLGLLKYCKEMSP